jgi:hypothetical protein
MAEIVNDGESQIPFFRNRVDVRDRAGGKCSISFYPEDGRFDFETLKTGSTILVTAGQKHNFRDGSCGLRIEYLHNVTVAPCSMSDLMVLSKLYHERQDRCWCCGGRDNPSDTSAPTGEGVTGYSELKRCAACRVARYCSKDCQTKDWKERHKRACKAVPVFQKLVLIDYSKCDNRAFLRLTQADLVT